MFHPLSHLWTSPHTLVRKAGCLLLSCLAPPMPQAPLPDKPGTILILSYEKAGDALLTTALIRLIKRHLPDTQIHVLAWPRNAEIYCCDPHIARLHVVEKDLSCLGLLRRLRRLRFDVLYNPKDHPSTTFLLLTMWIRAQCKVALQHRLQDRLYHRTLCSSLGSHTLEKHRPLLQALGVPFQAEDLRPVVYVPPQRAEPVDRFLKQAQTAGTPRVLFNLSARPENQWTAQCWVWLGREVQIHLPECRVLVVAHPSDQAKAEMVREGIGKAAVCVPALPTLLEVAALVGRMDVVVSPDTSIVHLCSALGVPLVGLYCGRGRGTSNYAPWLIPYRIVQSRNSKVRSIETAQVRAALLDLWSEVRPEPELHSTPTR